MDFDMRMELIAKARALPDGTRRKWGGKDFEKQIGKWHPVKAKEHLSSTLQEHGVKDADDSSKNEVLEDAKDLHAHLSSGKDAGSYWKSWGKKYGDTPDPLHKKVVHEVVGKFKGGDTTSSKAGAAPTKKKKMDETDRDIMNHPSYGDLVKHYRLQHFKAGIRSEDPKALGDIIRNHQSAVIEHGHKIVADEMIPPAAIMHHLARHQTPSDEEILEWNTNRDARKAERAKWSNGQDEDSEPAVKYARGGDFLANKRSDSKKKVADKPAQKISLPPKIRTPRKLSQGYHDNLRVKKLPDHATHTDRHEVPSESSPGKKYIVAKRRSSGKWECSCPMGIYHKDCKHMREVVPRIEAGEFENASTKRIGAKKAPPARKTRVAKGRFFSWVMLSA